MASLDSEEVKKALTTKLKCEEQKGSDHCRYVLRDGSKILSRTMISHGPRHDLGNLLVRLMARQIGLGTSNNLVQMVKCTLTYEECMKIIRAGCH